MTHNKYELNVLINGKPAREYYHKNRFFIEAKSDTEYSLKFKNHSSKRVMAVFSIDGIDVLTGKPAGESISGYIVNAFSILNVMGYRVDNSNVITFKFDDGRNSYATEVECNFDPKEIKKVKRNEKSAARNNGVIGVRVWEEDVNNDIPAWNNVSETNYSFNVRNSNIKPFGGLSGFNNVTGCNISKFSYSGTSLIYCSGGTALNTRSLSKSSNKSLKSFDSGGLASCNYLAQSSADPIINQGEYVYAAASMNSVTEITPNFSLGTSWGHKVEDKVTKINFKKVDVFTDLEIFYLPRVEMINIGIDLENSKKVFISGMPSAFDNNEYCRTSVNWKGDK